MRKCCEASAGTAEELCGVPLLHDDAVSEDEDAVTREEV